MQLDFSENYAVVQQDEIQSAHWAHSQVTVFTCVVWVGGTSQSYGIVSDYLSHDKYAVYKFIEVILTDIRKRFPYTRKVCFFSDGAASQFKQKYLFVNLGFLKQEYELESPEWSFFAASHGKGAVDGICGTIKRSVWQKYWQDMRLSPMHNPFT